MNHITCRITLVIIYEMTLNVWKTSSCWAKKIRVLNITINSDNFFYLLNSVFNQVKMVFVELYLTLIYLSIYCVCVCVSLKKLFNYLTIQKHSTRERDVCLGTKLDHCSLYIGCNFKYIQVTLMYIVQCTLYLVLVHMTMMIFHSLNLINRSECVLKLLNYP